MKNVQINRIYKDGNGNTTVSVTVPIPEAWKDVPFLKPIKHRIQTNGNLPKTHGYFLAFGAKLEKWAPHEVREAVSEIETYIQENGPVQHAARINVIKADAAREQHHAAHTCPYKEDVLSDSQTLCTCNATEQAECSKNI